MVASNIWLNIGESSFPICSRNSECSYPFDEGHLVCDAVWVEDRPYGCPYVQTFIERLEVVETGRCPHWTEDEELRIVAESLSGSRLVSSTARRYGISRSLLTTRRRQFQVQPQTGGEAGSGFVPAVDLAEGRAGAPAFHRRHGRRSLCRVTRRIIVYSGVDMNSLALRIQQALRRDPYAGDLYVFRGKSGKLIKIFWYDGLGPPRSTPSASRRDASYGR